MIRVLIVDDHLVVREGLQLILGLEGDIVVVGEAADGATAVRLAGELQPDVALMDLRMPGMDGLEAIGHIRAQWPEIAIIILTTYNEDELLRQGLQAGARSFLLKDTDRETLFRTIRAAARGETLLQPEILQRALQPPPAKREATAVADDTLTEREMMVLTAVTRGDRNKEIAQQLGVAERTVKAHLTNIYNKLGVESRAEATAVALQRGILSHSAGNRHDGADV